MTVCDNVYLDVMKPDIISKKRILELLPGMVFITIELFCKTHLLGRQDCLETQMPLFKITLIPKWHILGWNTLIPSVV